VIVTSSESVDETDMLIVKVVDSDEVRENDKGDPTIVVRVVQVVTTDGGAVVLLGVP